MTPDELEKITNRIENVARELHNRALIDISERVVARFNRIGKIELTASDVYQLSVVQESGVVRDQVFRDLAKLLNVGTKEIKEAFEKAVGLSTQAPTTGTTYTPTPPTKEERQTAQELYTRAIDEDRLVMPINTNPINAGTLNVAVDAYIKAIAQRDYEATAGTFRNLIRSTAEASQKAYVDACDKAYTMAKTGMVSLDQAVADAITDLAGQGIQFVSYSKTDKNGNTKVHKDTIETAVLRATRTAVNQSTAEIVLAKMREMGDDCVQVSSHLGARDKGTGYENHSLWQGKQYSLSGDDPDLPAFYLSTGYGTGAGLCGWNCRHTITSGIKGFNTAVQYDKDENHKAYELSQKMRYMERNIRKQKRIVSTLEQVRDTSSEMKTRYEAELQKLRGMTKQYNEFCRENKMYPEETRLRIN